MIKIEKTVTFGWESAIRGARNAYQSWNKSDSEFPSNGDVVLIGKADLDLLSKLSKAGSDHAKFMRMIHVQTDITAPLYWWKEQDQYRIGVTTNSTSTMHSIHKRKFDLDDFSHDMLFVEEKIETVIDWLNKYRDLYVNWNNGIGYVDDDGEKVNKKDVWWQMIQLLPSSYNQLRTIDLNYAVLKNIYHARKDHKLDEWHGFCHWIEGLPYSKELIIDGIPNK